VSEHPNLDLIHAYNEAWIGGDMAAAARYLAEDVTFESPNQHLRSREAFIASTIADSSTTPSCTRRWGSPPRPERMPESATEAFSFMNLAERQRASVGLV